MEEKKKDIEIMSVSHAGISWVHVAWVMGNERMGKLKKDNVTHE